jgi:hypothetical protein
MANYGKRSGEHPARRGLIGHEMILLIESAPADRRRTNQWTIGAKTSTAQFAALREIELRAQRNLVIRCRKEWITKAKRHRTRNNAKAKIKKIRDCCHRTPYEPTSTFDHFGGCFGGRPSCVGGNRSSRRFGFETSACATSAQTALGLNTDVPDMPRVAIGTIKQTTVKDDSTTNTGRHDHGQIVIDTLRCAQPTFT